MSETTEPSDLEAFPAAGGAGEQDTADLSAATGPAPVLVSIAPPAPQARLTVAFRGILAIPQYIVVAALSIAAGVVAFIGWWAALFTGQLPEWAFTFLTGVLRWSTRLNGYTFLLTDRYPPFDFEDSDYPIRLVTEPTRLNRLAVLFRVVLVIPAYVVVGVAGIGAAVIGLAAWVITLVAGRLPDALHQAIGAILRFQARYSGYLYLVTPEYPWGLFGDRPEPEAAEVPEPEAAEVPEPEAAVAGLASDAVADEPAVQEHVSGEGATADLAEPAPAAVQAAAPWRLTVAGSGRALIVLAIVLGIGASAAGIALSATQRGTVSRAQALATIDKAASNLDRVTSRFPTQAASCGNTVSCVNALDIKVANAFASFASSVQSAGVPSQYSGQTAALVNASNKVASDLRQLATAKSVAQYQSIFSQLGLQGAVSQFQSAASQLHNSLAIR